jgi:hypothetical protein
MTERMFGSQTDAPVAWHSRVRRVGGLAEPNALVAVGEPGSPGLGNQMGIKCL